MAGPPERELSASAASVVIFGLGPFGLSMARELTGRGVTVLGVDFDPVAIRHARAAGLEAVFGDASDPEQLTHLPLTRADWVVSALPAHGTGPAHDEPAQILLHGLRDLEGVASRPPPPASGRPDHSPAWPSTSSCIPTATPRGWRPGCWEAAGRTAPRRRTASPSTPPRIPPGNGNFRFELSR